MPKRNLKLPRVRVEFSLGYAAGKNAPEFLPGRAEGKSKSLGCSVQRELFVVVLRVNFW
jgi:hypothetical protein